MLIKSNINALEQIWLHTKGLFRYMNLSEIEIIIQIKRINCRINWNLVFVHYVLYQFTRMIGIWQH